MYNGHTTDYERARDALPFVSADEREHWVKTAFALKDGLGEDAFELFDQWSQSASNYCPKAAHDVWKSAKAGGGIGFGTLFHEAKANGWQAHKLSESHTVEDEAAKQAQQLERESKAQAERAANERKQATTLKKVQATWEAAKPATTHPYSTRKAVEPTGLRTTGEGLLIPMRDAQGHLCSLQTINPDGSKLFEALPNRGLYYPIDGDADKPLYICEGWATGASISKATGAQVAVAFTAGNLLAVAQAMRQKCPNRTIVICGDDDHEKPNNAGKTAADKAALAIGAMVVFPTFNKPAGKTDFNDMHQEQTLKAVAAALEKAAKPSTQWAEPMPLVAPEQPEEPYPVEALGVLLGQAAQALAEHVKAPLPMCAHSVLGAAALACQRLFNAPHMSKPSGMPCSLNLLTQGVSGSRKSTCDGLALYPIHKLERQLQQAYKESISEYQTAKAAAKKAAAEGKAKGKKGASFEVAEVESPTDPRMIFREPTIEHVCAHLIMGGNPAIGVFSDEAGFLGGHSMKSDTRNAAIAALTTLFDDGKAERLRRTDKEACGTAYDRRMSVHLMAQPIVLRETLGDPLLQQQGFLPRFLFCAPKSLHGTRIVEPEDLSRKASDDERITNYWTRVQELMNEFMKLAEDGGVAATVLEPDPDAWECWRVAFNLFEQGQAQYGKYSGLMVPFASRAGELAWRVATVLAGFQGKPSIDVETIESAWLIVEYSLGEWERVLLASNEDAELVAADRLLEWLKNKPQHRTFLSIQKNGPKPRPNAPRLRSLLMTLKNHGWIRSADEKFTSFVVWGDK